MPITPGHTPGTLSLVIPVSDHGVRHTAILWGGTSYPRDRSQISTYISSIDRFASIAAEQAADVELSSHPSTDGSLLRMAQLRAGAAPNPVVRTPEDIQNFLGVMKACGEVRLASPPLRREDPQISKVAPGG